MGYGGIDFWHYLREVVGVHIDSHYKEQTCYGCGSPLTQFNRGKMCNRCFLLLMELSEFRSRLKRNFGIVPSASISKLIRERLNPELKDIPPDPAEPIPERGVGKNDM